jgi:putative transcriptional regulator
VVLILSHGDDGAYGVVVNRPAEDADLPLPVFSGGPCESPGLVMLHAHADWVDGSASSEGSSATGREVAPGIFVGDAECLERAANVGPGEVCRYRVFQGYSGWGPGQLEQEIGVGAWSTVAATPELVFDVAPDELWFKLKPRLPPEPSAN